jgi:hypothetical protein
MQLTLAFLEPSPPARQSPKQELDIEPSGSDVSFCQMRTSHRMSPHDAVRAVRRVTISVCESSFRPMKGRTVAPTRPMQTETQLRKQERESQNNLNVRNCRL